MALGGAGTENTGDSFSVVQVVFPFVKHADAQLGTSTPIDLI